MSSEPLRVIVDADASPRSVLNLLRTLQDEFGYRLTTVASFNHNIESHDHVMVGDGPDEADLAIMARLSRGSIVVTMDWGLAALVLAAGGKALSPSGYEYRSDTIDFLLAERHIKAKARRAGLRTRGPKRRAKADDIRFEKAFRALLDDAGYLSKDVLFNGEGDASV